MSELLKRYLQICLLAKGPQDLPFSVLLTCLSLLFYFITGFFALLTLASGDVAALAMLVNTGILLVFCWACLQVFRLPERWLQMIAALAGVGVLFHLLSLPLLAQSQNLRGGDQVPAELSLLLLFLLSWNLAVVAHIFRETYNVRLSVAFILTVVLVVIELSASQILFPELEV
jgi:hypothetical protein